MPIHNAVSEYIYLLNVCTLYSLPVPLNYDSDRGWCDGAVAGRETWTQTPCRVLRSWRKGVNHYTGEGHPFTCNLGWELRLHPSHTPPLRRKVNSPDRKSERGLRRERRKGLDEGGKAWRRGCCKWNRRSEGCVIQKVRRIITCSSCVFNHVGKSPHVTVQ